VPTEDIDAFLTLARSCIRQAYCNIALHPLAAAEEADMWRFINGVEAAIKLRNISLEDQHELLDRELEQQFRNTR
jgi:hypothetical protein